MRLLKNEPEITPDLDLESSDPIHLMEVLDAAQEACDVIVAVQVIRRLYALGDRLIGQMLIH